MSPAKTATVSRMTAAAVTLSGRASSGGTGFGSDCWGSGASTSLVTSR